MGVTDHEFFQMNVTKAMHRIENLYYETGGDCYLSFSGGKDSTIVLALIKLCEEVGTIPKNAIPALFANTKIELDVTYEFINWVSENWYGNVVILEPDKPFAQVIKEYGKPVKSKLRAELLRRYQKNPKMKSVKMLFDKHYARSALADKDLHLAHNDIGIMFSAECCNQLKKEPFKKYAEEHDIKGYFTGERLAEGGIRQAQIKKRVASGKPICTRISGDYIIKQPIVDWTDEIVEWFIEQYQVPLSDAYTVYGMTRTECAGCPFSKNLDDELRVVKEFEPKRYKACMFWLKDVYIAQNVVLPFDEEYEKERKEKWDKDYHRMRYEMLKKLRPNCRLCKKYESEVKNNEG